MKIQKLEKELTRILTGIIEREESINKKISPIHPDYKPSAKNLLRYLILRSEDLRKYHGILSDLGVSSLRSAEGYVYSNLYNVVKILNLLQGKEIQIHSDIEIIGYSKSMDLLRKHSNDLFNEGQNEQFTEIMVTLPNESVDDKEMIMEMVLAGMEIARINLSHGDIDIWEKMVNLIGEIRSDTGKKLKIYMDLSGPKLRTAAIEVRNKKGEIKNAIPVRTGDHIILTKRETPGKKAIYNDQDEVIAMAEVGVLLHEVIDDTKVGDVILFDDGMIRSVVVAKMADALELRLTECYKTKLGAHKGINVPDTKLNLPALTPRDKELLPFICEHADIVGYSFVRTEDDVRQLYAELEKYNARHMGVVFKIENKEAFQNLPGILIKGMERNKIGVMIARGDLAVELGFERISEVQNQILWLCEAAHIPVIWATQVLDNLARTGIPTRAEISDAAKAAQAECVMLNKGPHINSAIRILKNILIRMGGHVFKKKSELRALNVAQLYVQKFDEIEQ